MTLEDIARRAIKKAAEEVVGNVLEHLKKGLLMTTHRRLAHPTFAQPAAPAPKKRMVQASDPSPPSWPSYTGTSEYVGTSSSGVSVFVDPSLGAPALQNAQDLLADADRVMAANAALFGAPNGAVQVIVFALGGATDGTGGADHMGCDFTTGPAIEVCAAFGNSMRVSALFEAELSECSMGCNLCGESTGEALSRWCAAIIGNNALSDFATAPQWANDGMPDFVNTTDPTDQNADSTGCGMAFISWLQSLGYVLSTIAPVMVALSDGGTFAALYAKLTGDAASNAWPKFQAAVQALPGGVTGDDPFAWVAPAPTPAPAPQPSPPPVPAPTPGPVTLTLGQVEQLLAQNWPTLVSS